MSEETTVRTEFEIDSEVRDRAGKVFEEAGLSFADAFRLLVTRAAEDGTVPQGLDVEYDAWFRQQVQEALDDPTPPISDEDMQREMHAYKEELRRKFTAGEL